MAKTVDNDCEIPLIESAVPAGFPSIAEDYVDRALNLQELLVKHPAATFFVRVKGTSMIDAGIQTNDILIVDRALTPTNNKIVIARIDGELTVKRLRLELNKTMLVAENSSYEPIEITSSMDFEIWGVVTYVIHQV
jgi:DNA polymerase V